MDLSHLKGITSTNEDPSSCAICSNQLPAGPHHQDPSEFLSVLAFCCGKRYCRSCKTAGFGSSPDQDGVTRCALCDREKSNFRDEVQMLKRHAKRGRPWAQFNLSISINEQRELIVESSYDAVRWFRKAADLGHPGACLRLGEHYAVGDGCFRDIAEARKVLEKAVSLDNNYVDAVGEVLVKIARVCWRNNEIEEAISILTPLAEGGGVKAQLFLGCILAENEKEYNACKWLTS